MMNDRPGMILFMVTTAGLLVVAVPVFGDHNSKNGEGWANMPNDIHNTRVETLESDGNDEFRDFVRNGDGAESVNRYESDGTVPENGRAKVDGANEHANPAVDATGRRSEAAVRKTVREKNRMRDRDHTKREAKAPARIHKNATPTRGGGRRGGGKRGG